MELATTNMASAVKSPKSVSIALPQSDTTQTTHLVHGDADAVASRLDTVAWPINRCCYEELTSSELLTIEHRFVERGDDTPALLKWVVVHKPSHHTHHFAKRLLVVSSFRVTLFKRRRTPLTTALVVSKEYQLLHLDAIDVLLLRATTTLQASDPTAVAASIKLRFHPPSRHHDNETNGWCDRLPHGDQLEIHFDPGIHAETIVRLCQRKLHALRLVFPSQRPPRLALPPPCAWQEFFTMRATPSSPLTRPSLPSRQDGDALATAYQCFCDDLGVPFRASVALRLRQSLDAACVDFQYCLASSSLHTQSPVMPARHDRARSASMLGVLARMLGVSALSASALQAKEVHALARTLAHAHCVKDIVVDNISMGDVALQSLFHALRSSDTVSGTVAVNAIALTNVSLTTKALRTLQHIVLQSTIRCTTTAAGAFGLRRLDLSFNAFSSRMAQTLATILELLPCGLDSLQLEQCHLSMHSSSRILSAMKTKHGFSSSLRELTLSGNTLGVVGTHALALWITGAFALHRLDLSRTRLQTTAFMQAFQQNSILHESSLQTLDLSYNRMGTQASVALGNILGRTQSLATLVLRGMTQTRLHPRRLLSDLLSSLTQSKKSKNRHGVRRTTYGLRTVHLQNILGPMLQNSARACPCQIDLSENHLGSAQAAVVARLMDSAPHATLASLRLDDAALTDKTAVLLLHSLRACTTLASLSLEGNGFVKRDMTQSYKRFHAAASKSTISKSTAVEKAAADALSLLLGGKTTETTSPRDAHDKDHSFTQLYHHRPKKVPLRELSLRARGRVVFGETVLTAVVHALTGNATLQMLDVSGNECGDALARALGKMLPANRTLQVLYWDDNFTTVDGFTAFYDGLLRNETLSVVQLPINDTRRILEEQKDPPREKLFSVLGKIFKVTERNQTLAQATRDHKKSQPRSKNATSPRRKREHETDNQSLEKSVDERAAKVEDGEPEEMQDEPVVMPTSAECVDVALQDTRPESDTHWTGRYTTRYPTTIQSWSRDGPTRSGDDVRASWDQIGSLASMLT